MRREGIIPARAGFTQTTQLRLFRHRDHPRSRGVYGGSPPSCATCPGSSPLARGLRDGALVGGGEPGIIPARAGFTILVFPFLCGFRDHPRSRGVYGAPRYPDAPGRGSSPLARGLLERGVASRMRSRIIPARAGFTTRPRRRGRRPRDHPRSRGVYSEISRRHTRPGGSSPLARGLRPRLHARIPGDRIIPARAGFTYSVVVMSNPSWDHPRSRGVYYSWCGCPFYAAGSSPLARGLLRGGVRGDRAQRIIPARAGFTPRGPPPSSRGMDHPRSRGVYHSQSASRPYSSGSSPLARGLRRSPRASSSARTDHPRSRGVYGSPRYPGAPGRGSSPLARGLHRF